MKKIRIAIGQINPTVGDFPGNTHKIIHAVREASRGGADLIAFPEAALCGYPVWDLANKKSFVTESLSSLNSVARSTRGLSIAVAVGFIDRGTSKDGRSRNSLAWIENGKVRCTQAKRLLPTYDVFLEDIFFEPGKQSRIIHWKGLRIGPMICEDLWDQRYDVKPLRDLARQKVDLVINLSASPYYRGVTAVRDTLLKNQSSRYKLPILYVNQTGCQDDLIFDGRSLFAGPDGRILFRAPSFQERISFFDWIPGEKQASAAPSPLEGSIPEVYEALCLGVRDYCAKNGFKKAVIGLSGGIDSALVACLAVDALGPEAVLGVTMPGPYSSPGSWKDSEELACRLGMPFNVRSIKPAYSHYSKTYARYEGLKRLSRRPTLAMENLQARLRGLELMYLSNHDGRLLLTTGNKSELAMGYCTLYGDMAGGLSVIGDVYKTDVYRLAQARNRIREVIPQRILKKAPSAELRPNQKDQDSLPPYEVLDEILKHYIEKNESRDQISRKLQKKRISPSLIQEVIRRVDHNEYKRRQTPPILRVTEKAWFGRRMPITNRFQN